MINHLDLSHSGRDTDVFSNTRREFNPFTSYASGLVTLLSRNSITVELVLATGIEPVNTRLSVEGFLQSARQGLRLVPSAGNDPTYSGFQPVTNPSQLRRHLKWWRVSDSNRPGYLLAKQIRVPCPFPIRKICECNLCSFVDQTHPELGQYGGQRCMDHSREQY